ncbi:MAG: hypothetical protein H6707_10100 [Deltaproteobacteria bacterium]|nr:hypothetical protein [Deltaproteobacteria bacterium]
MTQSSGAESSGNEPDVTPIVKLSLWGVGIVLAVAVSIFIVRQLVLRTTSAMAISSLPENTERVAQQARMSATLGSYGYVDKSKGVYRLPIDQAMQRLVAKPLLLVDPDRAAAPQQEAPQN